MRQAWTDKDIFARAYQPPAESGKPMLWDFLITHQIYIMNPQRPDFMNDKNVLMYCACK